MTGFWLIYDWTLTEFWLHFNCILTEFRPIPTEIWLEFNWILTEIWLNFGWFQTEFWLISDWISTHCFVIKSEKKNHTKSQKTQAKWKIFAQSKCKFIHITILRNLPWNCSKIVLGCLNPIIKCNLTKWSLLSSFGRIGFGAIIWSPLAEGWSHIFHSS